MSVNTEKAPTHWWEDDPTQRYWMEVITRPNWGTELTAPDEPKYSLMEHVKVGDVVLHWIGKNNPMGYKAGMYGASVVAGRLQRRTGSWQGKPANIIPLTNCTMLPVPYLLQDLRAERDADLSRLKKHLEGTLRESGNLHFPFNWDPRFGLKTNQRHLTKMPVEVLNLVPNLLPEGDWVELDRMLHGPQVPGQNGVRQRYAGFCADPVLKKAIEMQAVSQAKSHYESNGYTVEDVGAYRSYDLHAVRGDVVRHVEVKGSQGNVEKILLTRNEVTHAKEYDSTDLVVVAEIPWERQLDGSVDTQDGYMDVHPDWRPSPENLKPLSYEYFLD